MGAHRRISGGKRQPMLQCLADQHAVKGIPMQVRQAGEARNTRLVEGQGVDAMSTPLLGQIELGRRRQRQLAQPMLDLNLPDRHWAQKHGVSGVADAVSQVYG